MKYLLLTVLSLLALSCTGKDEVPSVSSLNAEEKTSHSPEALKALGEKDCDEKAKAKEQEANVDSIGLNKKSNQGCTLE